MTDAQRQRYDRVMSRLKDLYRLAASRPDSPAHQIVADECQRRIEWLQEGVSQS